MYDRSTRWHDAPGAYPDPAVVQTDPRFADLILPFARIERIAGGCRWTEGPVWFGDQRCLVWSDIPNNRIMKWDEQSGEVSVWRRPSDNANGGTRDAAGRLVTCEHRTRRVTRTEYDGSITVLADAFEGRRLNSPNDVTVAPDGSLWFTDPTYGILGDYEGRRAEPEIATAVYRIDPDGGEPTRMVTGPVQPNGLCFSPDGATFYLVDTGVRPGLIYAYPYADGTLGEPRRFCVMEGGSSDGIACDAVGNVWAAAQGDDGYRGVHVFAPDGTDIGRLLLPEQCSNVEFGGLLRNRLFMTASQSVYSLYVNVSGA
ncbi:MAG TPA: SMP-30/gluconolactonase/LRE family protein [Propionibacteriaceae bacterium]|nr:SMP-30/gluconolactonase/LRE family protein [Propionibacteriaceae bacterium]